MVLAKRPYMAMGISFLTEDQLFSEEELGRAASDLLASSNMDRYARKATEHAHSTQLWNEKVQINKIVMRAWSAARRVSSAKERTLEETVLAFLLVFLSENPQTKSDSLFSKVASLNNPAAVWVASFAQRLRDESYLSHEFEP